MKILILVFIWFTSIIANNLESPQNSIDQNKSKRNEEMTQILTSILKDVKKYTKKNQKKNQKLIQELDKLKKEFKEYKIQKREEINKINAHLNKSKQIEATKETIIYTETDTTETMTDIIPNNTSWIEITVQDEIDIYQLALLYYGERDKYKDIYAANKNRIGKNLEIYHGMSLKIPMTVLFKEQPIILNTD